LERVPAYLVVVVDRERDFRYGETFRRGRRTGLRGYGDRHDDGDEAQEQQQEADEGAWCGPLRGEARLKAKTTTSHTCLLLAHAAESLGPVHLAIISIL
jgi:hypothetical protein